MPLAERERAEGSKRLAELVSGNPYEVIEYYKSGKYYVRKKKRRALLLPSSPPRTSSS
jgi:hypothetical protein